MILADTDVLIDFLRGKGDTADRVALEIERGQLRTTVISRFELLSGAASPRDEERVRTLLAAIPALPLDDDAADRGALVRKDLDSEGRSIGMGDSLIAGIALARGLVLLTRNVRHFARVKGLVLGRA